MSDLKFTAAFGNYDRTAPLRSGAVKPDGIDLRVLTMQPTEIFTRMIRYQEFEVSEMSMGAHLNLIGLGESPFVAMPAFPSRVFRHSMVYANVDAGIERPEDLNGKRIAIQEWGMTAMLWIVGILTEEYGFDANSVEWMAALPPRASIRMPEGAKCRYMEADDNLSDLLESGAVDAALIHQVPRCFAEGSPRVKRVFSDFKAAEIDYYRRTGSHPIMHCVVLRRDVYECAPWALRNIYTAMCEAREIAMHALLDNGALSAMVPLLPALVEESRQIFGANFWPYGVKANRKTLESLLLYAHQQGLTPRRLAVKEVFGENVLEERSNE